MEILTKSAKETKNFGRKISANLKGGETLALVGDLGSGKTTFVQGLAEGLGIDGRVTSPTFILMREHELPVDDKPSNIGKLYHLDLYRLEKNIKREVEDLGLPDIWEKGEDVVVVEWAEKAKEVFPENTIWINFDYINENERKIVIKNYKL